MTYKPKFVGGLYRYATNKKKLHSSVVGEWRFSVQRNYVVLNSPAHAVLNNLCGQTVDYNGEHVSSHRHIDLCIV